MIFMKLEVLLFINISIIFSFFFGCRTKSELSIVDVVIVDCKVYHHKEPFTGLVNHYLKHDQIKILSVSNGNIKRELNYKNSTLFSERIFSKCETGEEKVYYENGNIFQSGYILNGVRSGKWTIYSRDGEKLNTIFY